LTSLYLYGNSTITDKGLEGLKNLTSLDLVDNITITKEMRHKLENMGVKIKK
jgi:hypothetical protein